MWITSEWPVIRAQSRGKPLIGCEASPSTCSRIIGQNPGKPGAKGLHESGLPENDSHELTAAEHTAMQVGTHTDVTATRVRGREVQALCQKAPRLRPRHETTRMPGLHAPARG